MGPVHLYLAAWVAGGVLLGASMLLDGREDADHDNPFVSPDAFGEKRSLPHGLPRELLPSRLRRDLLLRTLRRATRVVPMGLIGFGLAGLTAKGLELDLWPWTFVCALLVGASVVGLGYRLSRPRIA
jgi:hypothetical protein